MTPSIPDFCPACDATDKPFRLIQRATEQEFRGETLRVTSPALQCRHCGFGLLGPGHLAALRVATHDTYRRQHGLLTSGEIAARRKAMGLSQKRFAEFLGVGSASIERWEAGTHVQDKASDLLLRQRSDRGLYFNLRPAGRSTRSISVPQPATRSLALA
jgi:putative zinc finger/helix-turn-helix YgiT family protein